MVVVDVVVVAGCGVLADGVICVLLVRECVRVFVLCVCVQTCCVCVDVCG